MYPVLYESTELNFTSNGIGTLACTSCVVTEERNGIYECEFSIPATERHFNEITMGRIVLCPHDETGDLQPFVIYRATKPINGIVTFNAHHVSYGLSNVVVKPFEATSITQAFSKFSTEALTANPFTFWTDKNTPGAFKVKVPSSARSLLAGQEGSILDIYGGGEYEFDRYTVKLRQHRGADNGVTIRYGKNLSDIQQVFDCMDIYDSVIPYWFNEEEGTVVYGDTVTGTGRPGDTVIPLDMSEYFEEQPTAAQLEAAALTYLDGNTPWIPKNSIEVDFVALWQTDEYKDIAPLERVKLCDTVTVVFPLIGADIQEQVIRVEYDVLAERYQKIELGQPQATFAETIVSLAENFTKAAVAETYNDLEQAIEDATTLITGGSGGHVVISRDANGKPQEILIMDKESTALADKVLRINVEGIGFSSTGINGPYTTAWTLAGGFVADFITTGYLSCNRLKGGTLTLGGLNNGDGILEINDNDGNLSVLGNKDGIVTNSLTAEDYVYVDGGAGSYLKIPTENDELSYVEIDNGGMKITNRADVYGTIYDTTITFPSLITDYGDRNMILEADSPFENSVGYSDVKTVFRNGGISFDYERGSVSGGVKTREALDQTFYSMSGIYIASLDFVNDTHNVILRVDDGVCWIGTSGTDFRIDNVPFSPKWTLIGTQTGANARIAYTITASSEFFAVVKISGINYVHFYWPGIATGTSAWRMVNYYGNSNNGFVRIEIEPNSGGGQVELIDAYDGTTSVISSAELWLYGR